MSIGDALAASRCQVGLTVTQVSQRTPIRDPIIRAIENDDYAGCGGDFYARGHIRSIAKAVGADPVPLIREYDATHLAPQEIAAADVLPPTTPTGRHGRRRSQWAVALGLVGALGFVAYYFFSGSDHATSAASSARAQPVPHRGAGRAAEPGADDRPGRAPLRARDNCRAHRRPRLLG
ncbi:MAG TPA: helix-turn-helix domain-containing protein [Streptosporangiaceae bacterium]|nr:helix-turn-helix domain-containing protein [Streptosporangiaceae bacterium]